MWIDLNKIDDVKEILDYAKSLSFNFWVDEKGTIKHPSVSHRKPSDLSYEEAFLIINSNNPHWAAHYRDMSFCNDPDYWDFGGTNIGNNEYGEVFLWIQLTPENGLKVKEKFNLKLK